MHYVITGLLALVAVLAFATPQYLIGAIFTPKVAATVTPVGYFFAKVAAGFMIPAAVAANSLVHTPNKQLTLALGACNAWLPCCRCIAVHHAACYPLTLNFGSGHGRCSKLF